MATYFAEKAKYSHSFAHEIHNGLKQIILAKVLTGNSYLSEPNDTIRLPPIITTVKKLHGNFELAVYRYDTVNGFTQGHRVYMVYDSYKAYPLYLITYH